MTNETTQRTLEELRIMSPAEIAEAHADGQLEEILAGRDPGGDGRRKQVTEDELKSMSPAAINQAYSEGRCDQLLGRV